MSLSRRRFIKQTFAFSAAVALLGDTRFSLAADAVAAAPTGEPAQHYLAVGDYGVVKGDLARQQAVASAMIKYTAQTSLTPEALFMLGDNFYGGLGGKGVASDRWQWNLEAMYPAANFPGPMYAMLGNHDYNDEPNKAAVAAQLAYRAANPTARWTLPSKWYRLELPPKDPKGKSLATILVLDTDFSYRDEKMVGDAERQQQLDWLAAELDKPRTAPWLFVFGHHPSTAPASMATPRIWSAPLSRCSRRRRSISISPATITICSIWKSKAIRPPSSSAAAAAPTPAPPHSTTAAPSSKPSTVSRIWNCAPPVSPSATSMPMASSCTLLRGRWRGK
jgi:hypothetical protein